MEKRKNEREVTWEEILELQSDWSIERTELDLARSIEHNKKAMASFLYVVGKGIIKTSMPEEKRNEWNKRFDAFCIDASDKAR